jgi:hypothetical protein
LPIGSASLHALCLHRPTIPATEVVRNTPLIIPHLTTPPPLPTTFSYPVHNRLVQCRLVLICSLAHCPLFLVSTTLHVEPLHHRLFAVTNGRSITTNSLSQAAAPSPPTRCHNLFLHHAASYSLSPEAESTGKEQETEEGTR